jgi:hypothetical protein
MNGDIGVIGLLGERKRRGLRRSLDISSGKGEGTEVRGIDIRTGPYIGIGAGSEPRRRRGAQPAASRRYISVLRTDEVIDSDCGSYFLLLCGTRDRSSQAALHNRRGCEYPCSSSSGSDIGPLLRPSGYHPSLYLPGHVSQTINLEHTHIARRA